MAIVVFGLFVVAAAVLSLAGDKLGILPRPKARTAGFDFGSGPDKRVPAAIQASSRTPASPGEQDTAHASEKSEAERKRLEKEQEEKREHEFNQWLETAQLYLEQGRYKDAARSVRQALRIKPQDETAGYILKETEKVVYVPDNHATIQGALDDTEEGKLIVVTDGVYKGRGNTEIDFKGKAITLKSENGPENCIIDCGNSGRGFNFRNFESADSVLQGFTIRNGSVNGEGGAIFCSSTSCPTIKNCIISGNSAGNGGGISCWNSSCPTIINCLITKNSATGKGGAINCWNNAAPILINCTIVENSSDKRGGGVAAIQRSKPEFRNSIVWNNSVRVADRETTGRAPAGSKPYFREQDINGHEIYVYDGDSSVTLRNCCIHPNSRSRNSYGGKGSVNTMYTITEDPQFETASLGDYRLSRKSPCIDIGLNDHVPENVKTDIAGNTRIISRGGRSASVDIGAFEH
jgi:predicted outer membrane repeat protein